MENEHGPCALADDEVALPMAASVLQNETGRVRLQMMRSPSQWPPRFCVDSLRPFMDGDPIFDRISRGPRSARTPALVRAREISQVVRPFGKRGR